MFENIASAPADPILGLNDTFNKDERAEKINLGVGVFQNNEGITPILGSVKKAEAILLKEEKSKAYLKISGNEAYGLAVQKLLFGENAEPMTAKRVVTAQAPGGTAALRIAADFIKQQAGVNKIWASKPTWANHKAIFSKSDLEIGEYRYYDANNRSLDFDAMCEDLNAVPAGDVVLLHGCCHNPTGVDPTVEQWQQIAEIAADKGWIALFDFAYQGFAKGVEEDAQGLRTFLTKNRELLVASSFSKNFGLYNERVGACTLVAENTEQAQSAFSQMKVNIRANYSNPPAHGALVVNTILSDSALSAEWLNEVKEMRERIKMLREKLVSTLAAKGAKQDFSFIKTQNGMFSFSGLNPEQVQRLRDDFAIYMVGSGRINVAGISENNIDYLCDAIVKVMA